LQFNDPASEMFTMTVVIKGHLPDPAGGSGSAGTSGSESGGTSGSSSSSAFSLPQIKVMQITVNPLTQSMTTKLL
jgi:hypothetical protein